jgi:hypothetical protein
MLNHIFNNRDEGFHQQVIGKWDNDLRFIIVIHVTDTLEQCTHHFYYLLVSTSSRAGFLKLMRMVG